MPEVTLFVPDSVALGRERSLNERQMEDTTELLQERIAVLEFALEDEGWQLLSGGGEREFSRQGLKKIIQRSRHMYLENPMIRRPVEVMANYVFGQGVEFEAEDPDVNDTIQRFLDNPKNRAEFTSHQAMTLKDIELTVEGNIFFVYFPDPATGDVDVRSLPVDEVEDIITNPEDSKEPWFYRRVWVTQRMSGPGQVQEALYPDWRYKPQRKTPTYGKLPVLWDSPVYHVKTGGLSTMRFGIPPTYPAQDWAKAYRHVLEDDATRGRALTRWAMKLTVQGTAASMQTAKDKLQTTYGNAGSPETNPPPLPGSMFLGRIDRQGNKTADLEPVKLDGTMLPSDHGRPFRLMVCAALGLPETYFGDADVGNHATAKTMDRPTELMMSQRRSVWGDVYGDMFAFVLEKAVKTPKHVLRAKYRMNAQGDVEPIGKAKVDGLTATISVNWPPLLEHDVTEQVTAIATAATLAGHQAQPVLGSQTVARLFLTAMGVKNIDELITQWYGEEPDALPEAPPPPQPFGAPPAPGVIGEAQTLLEALREEMAR